jgi:hypothetical protein
MTVQDPGGLPIERYAAISAELRHAGPRARADVLGRAGIPGPAWEEADRLWKEVIEKDFEKIDGLLLTFAARFTEAMCRLEEPSPQASTAVESPPAPVPAPSAVPSFLQTPAPKEATPPLRGVEIRCGHQLITGLELGLQCK